MPHGLVGKPSNNRRTDENFEPKESQILVKVMRSQKAAYVKAAGGEKLSTWIRRVLDEAAKK